MALIQASVVALASRATTQIEYLYPGWPAVFLSALGAPSSIDWDAPYPLLDPVSILEIVSADKVANDGKGPENRTARMGENRTDTLRGYVNVLVRLANLLTDRFVDRDGVRSGLEVASTTYMRGPLDLDGNRIVDLAAGTLSGDLVTFAQFKEVQFAYEDQRDIADQSTLQRDSGLAMAGDLDMGVGLPGRRILNLGTPTLPSHLVTLAYQNTNISAFQNGYLPRTGVNPMTNSGAAWDMGNHGINGMANPTAAGDAVTKDYIDAIGVTSGSGSVPIGLVLPHMGGSIPSGFLLCDGREVSRSTHASLFATIGIAYGTPSGGTTFVLPDLRGRAIIGLDNMGGVVAARVVAPFGSSLGGVGGEQSHTLTSTELASHLHTYTDRYSASGSGGALTGETSPSTTCSQTWNVGGVTGSQGSGGAHNNMQPSIAVNWIIRG